MAKHRLTVEALVMDEEGRVLLVRQGEHRTGDWELPGGKVKRGESIAAAARREVLEETGVAVEVLGVVGIYFISDEDTHDLLMQCKVTKPSSPPRPNPPEITAAEWFPLTQLPTPMSPFTAHVHPQTERRRTR